MNKFFDKVLKNKKTVYIFIAILILFLFFILFFDGDNTSKKSDENEITQYKNDLENELIKTLSSIKGVGKVIVAININSGKETVLAMKTTVNEKENGKEIIESPVLVNGKTVVVKEIYPQISGVIIVAEGANDFNIYKKIQQATTSFLNTNVNNIEIMTMG